MWIIVAIVAVVVAAVVVVVVLFVRSEARPVAIDEAPRPTGSTLPAEPTEMRPPQGVYLYTGEGTDQLDLPPLSQAQGPQMPASVSHRDDGCWTFRIDFSTNHWQTWIHCPDDGDLVEEGGESYQRWDLGVASFDSTSTFTCSDSIAVKADQEPGDSWTQTCSGTSTGAEGEAISSGPVTFVGREDLAIGGETVTALHYRRERVMSGAQHGTETTEIWLAADTGLPLRNIRTMEATTSTVIGDVRYSETGRFEATSVSPVG